MRNLHALVVSMALVFGPLAGGAHGVDQPIGAERLTLVRTSSGREAMFFLSRDPRFLFPAIGSADDPAGGRPGGLHIDLFSQNDPRGASFTVPAAGRKREWKVNAAQGLYRWVGHDRAGGAGVKLVILRAGKGLLVAARRAGLALDAPQGAVGVRISTGSLRNCARFDGASVRRDVAGEFVARHAEAAALVDCEEASLRAAAATTTTTTSTSTSTTTSSTTTTTTTSTTTLPGRTYGNAVEFATPSQHSAGYLLGGRVTIPVASVVTHLSLIAKAGGARVMMGLYSDRSGLPSRRVLSTEPTALAAGAVEIPVNPTPIAAGTYWLMAVYDADASVGLDESDPNAIVVYAPVAFTSPLPDPFPPATGYGGQRFNYYVRVQ